MTFLVGYKGIFNVTILNNKFYFKKSLIDEDFIQITLSPGAYEIKSLNNEIKRIIIDEEHFTESNYPFRIKPIFFNAMINRGNFIRRTDNWFVFDDNIGSLLGFHETILYKEYNPSPNPVDILSFNNIFIECDIAKGMIFKGKRSRLIHNWTMTVDPDYKNEEKFAGGVAWYIMESKDDISIICFKLKNENGNLVSFHGQLISFHLSFKKI